MLKSLPVADPAQLYRIGDTGECCVEGWEDDDGSLFSYQLYQRLAAAAPEFEETTAFQAAPGISSIRQETIDREARPLRAEYVSGSYFHIFGLGAFAGWVINNSDDQRCDSSRLTTSDYKSGEELHVEPQLPSFRPRSAAARTFPSAVVLRVHAAGSSSSHTASITRVMAPITHSNCDFSTANCLRPAALSW